MIGQMIESFNERCRRMGYAAFSWWIPVAMDAFAVAAACLAVAQRSEQGALVPAALLVAVALVPWFVEFAGVKVHWLVFLAVTLGSTSVLIATYPVSYDFSVLVWILLIGRIGATEPILRALAASAIAVAGVVALAVAGRVDGLGFALTGLVVGCDVGVVMQYLQRRLDEETVAHAEHEAQAVLQERQRIAREVHDVIAHSLSVTMLHLTAARRSLEEDRTAGVDEAVDALRDAELLGRRAMADIRHTVGLLGQAPGESTVAAPDLRDVPALVSQFRGAGLDVDLDVVGDPEAAPSTVGLGIYRIAQESLSNVAKHQPDARARVELVVAADGSRLTVWNDLAAGHRRGHSGSGLRGMRERADLLGATFSAGPRGRRWVVEVALATPATDTEARPLMLSDRASPKETA